MKKTVLLVMCLMLIASAASASSCVGIAGKILNSCVTHPDGKDLANVEVGIDVPNLVKLPWNLSVGAEMSKDLNQTNAKEGYTYLGKVTWTGSLLDFSKK